MRSYSVSCVGTCSDCGTRRFLLSDTMSLQLNNGLLKCLPHPGESWSCEKFGLTLGQASKRGRLFRETFYICRNCGQPGETIETQVYNDFELFTFTIRQAATWGWGSALILAPLFIWMRWWEGLVVVVGTLLAFPAITWREHQKLLKAREARGFPHADAPGRLSIPSPTMGYDSEKIVGRKWVGRSAKVHATGPCCDKPDWIPAFGVTDEDHVPCAACHHGVWVVSDHAIH